MNPTVSVIILSYNTSDLLRDCLVSVQASVGTALEIIVVDNASTDGSAEMVAKEFPKVQLVRLQRNMGFAAGNNAGIKVAKGKYIMLLNSDAVITGNAIGDMAAFLTRNPDVGLVTPKVILPDGAVDLACHRGMPTPWNAFTYFTKLESLFPSSKMFGGYHQTWQDFDQSHAIDATAATAILVRLEAITQVGMLDERFFLYAEDLDWCKRFTDAGWKIMYFPKAKVIHHKSASGKRKTNSAGEEQARKEAASHFYDTMKQFYEKHYDKKYPKWLRQLVYLGISLKKRVN